MPVDLNAPLDWEAAVAAGGDELTMLDALQPNILRPHVREHLSVLFLHFGDQAEARAFLAGLADSNAGTMKSAHAHLDEVKRFKSSGIPGTPYVGVGLTAAGYAALGVTAVPGDASFVRGMTDPASRQTLADPPVSTWEQPYRQPAGAEVHAVVLVGDADEAPASAAREAVLAAMPDSVTVLAEEIGVSQRNPDGAGIEHFGYIDGRSQPLFLTEDIQAEQDTEDGTNVWDPAAPLGQVLVPEPGAADPNHHGSYFIFRKLEQNVRRFRQAEQDLADALGLVDADRDRAGAMLVGRFRDGAPLTLQKAAGAHSPIMNNFTYDSDVGGTKCPFHAHIRKTNPRGSGGAEALPDEKRHQMARRGQTYGERADVPFDESVPIAQRPTGGVGLLFMAFNSKIHFSFQPPPDIDGAQFDFMQATWANNAGFPFGKPPPPPGLDPVIGQGARPDRAYPPAWGAALGPVVDPVAQAVRMRGGEYFFMPSLPFLRAL